MLTKESNEIPDSSKPALGYVPEKLVLLRAFTTSKETSERKKKTPNKPTHQQNCGKVTNKKSLGLSIRVTMFKHVNW